MKKKNAFRIIALLMAVIMVFFSGCGDKSNNGSKKTNSSKKDSSDISSSDVQTQNDESDSSSSTIEPSQTTNANNSNLPSVAEMVNVDNTITQSKKPSTIVNSEVSVQLDYVNNSAYLYGVGYVENQMCNRVQVEQAVYLMRALGVKSCRIWASCMYDSNNFVDWRIARLHELVKLLNSNDIQVIFNMSGFESQTGGILTTFMPYRNTSENSDYMYAIRNFETMWYNMAKEFPDVLLWEVGNEWNHDGFLNPVGWNPDGTGVSAFTLKEKADISTDLMYSAVKGIRKSGNKGEIIMAALAPEDGMDGITMTHYLEFVYQNIESGEFGSKNRSDYFDYLAWHPYISHEPDMEWVENNNAIYQIAVNHGDNGIKVFLTEFGYFDGQNSKSDLIQSKWMVKAYELIRKHMGYVESLHYYRLFTDSTSAEDYYGLINQPEDGFNAKQKAYAYQQMTGAKGNLNKFYLPLDD